MIDLKNLRLADYQVVEIPKNPRNTEHKMRCTFYHVKPGSYRPERKAHLITDMPIELYESFFQERV